MAAVETTFNNTSDKKDSAWLIQWVINNKLVCNITLYFLFLILISSSGAQIVFSFQSVRNSNLGNYFYIYFSGTNSSLDSNVSDLQKITLGNCKSTCITVTSICEIGRIGKGLGIGNVNNFSKIFKKKMCTKPLSLLYPYQFPIILLQFLGSTNTSSTTCSSSSTHA